MYVQLMNAQKMSDISVVYNLLKALEDNPKISQRQMAKHLNVSLGKINFCLNALIKKGYLKANNFRKSDNKIAYAYLITPQGLEKKARLTLEFLKIKAEQYEILRGEIATLEKELLKMKAAKIQI